MRSDRRSSSGSSAPPRRKSPTQLFKEFASEYHARVNAGEGHQRVLHGLIREYGTRPAVSFRSKKWTPEIRSRLKIRPRNRIEASAISGLALGDTSLDEFDAIVSRE